MSWFYHVTFTRNVPRIIKRGIMTFRTTNWVKADGTRHGDGSIYAFENEHDAVRWAAKMDWDHHKETGSGKISIVTFTAEYEWEEDTADPLSRAGQKGRWLKSRYPVWPERLVTVRRLLPAELRKAIKAQ
jgi:hypothetical protein